MLKANLLTAPSVVRANTAEEKSKARKSNTDIKTMNAALRFLKSPTVRFLGIVLLGTGVILAIHFGAIHLQTSALATKGIESGIGIALFGGGILNYRKEAVFELTLFYTLKSMKKWYNEVSAPFTPPIAPIGPAAAHPTTATTTRGVEAKRDLDFILGAIPLADRGHLDELKEKQGVTDVLSLNNLFELNTKTVLAEPVTPKMWREAGIGFHDEPCTDFLPLTDDQIDTAVGMLERLEETPLANGSKRKVYIHCKAGRGRSPTVLACHFLKKYQKEFRAEMQSNGGATDYNPAKVVVAHIKKARPDININKAQEAAIIRYWNKKCLAGKDAYRVKEPNITPGCRDALVRHIL